jgi:hypothetical protein
MKIAATCLALLSSHLICTAAPPVQAAERKTVFNTERIEYKSGTGPEKCRDKCSKRSGPDAKALLSEGWNIVNTSPKKVVAEEYWYVPCGSCEPHGCTCIGTEYTLQRNAPPPKAAPSDDERDTLKKENEALKRENSLLKLENERLRRQLTSPQKTQ